MKTKTDYQSFTTKYTSISKRIALGVGDIWSNAIRCKKCNETIRSVNRHDYVTCKCGAVSVDGGSWYHKVSAGNLDDAESLVEYYEIREEGS